MIQLAVINGISNLPRSILLRARHLFVSGVTWNRALNNTIELMKEPQLKNKAAWLYATQPQ